MLTRVRPGWFLPERAATPESLFLQRRQIVRSLAAGPILMAGAGLLAGCDEAVSDTGKGGQTAKAGGTQLADAADDPSAKLYPVERNPRYTLERELTDPELVKTYNNYYEFGSSKNVWQKAQELPIRPWSVSFKGLVEEEKEVGIDELLAAMPLEERLYRHRCVEAWSMTVPWSGFPMKALLDYARPLGSAKYVKMVSFMDPEVAEGQRAPWYPWPYVEGLTIEEAANELAFMGTGLYGKPMPKQNGAPLRLVTPWKYGFKSTKGIVTFEFTEERPKSFWEIIQASEYGFWANVNPEVPHPRWSQATERVLGQDERVPTQLYNGYGEYVASLYEGMEGERLFM